MQMFILAMDRSQLSLLKRKITHFCLFKVKTVLFKAKYKEYPEGGHDIWNMAIREPELLPWLFAQNKNTLK